MGAGRCELKVPTIDTEIVVRGVMAQESEGAKFVAAHLRYDLCRAWEGLKALVKTIDEVSLHRGPLGTSRKI